MQDQSGYNENPVSEIHELGLFARFKIRLADWRMRWNEWFNELSRPKKVFWFGGVSIVSFLVVAVVGWGVVKLAGGGDELNRLIGQNQNLDEIPEVKVDDVSEPRTETALLDGVKLTTSEFNKLMERRPLAISVENHTAARPQSGLDQAELVWEALVEGGITRFLPVYWRNSPEVVGPVRSMRKYFLDWVSELGPAAVMHIGMADSTNPEADALGYIRKYKVASLSFGVGHTFWRVSDRFAPHNAYSNTKELWTKQKTRWPKNFKVSADFLWQFKDESKKEDWGSAHEVSLNWDGWGQTPWSVRWVYDPEKNEYQRFHSQQPHLDAVTNKQLVAKNVAVAFMRETLADDGTARIVYDTIGEGRSLVFLDGRTIEGTWKKPERMARTRFYDSDGKEVVFNRGKTWIMVVPENSEISY